MKTEEMLDYLGDVLENAEAGNTELEGNSESEPMIYTGPNVFALNLQRFRVFRGGIPPATRRAIEKIPEIESLIVPVSELEEMRQKIDKPGTNESRLFATVQKEAAKLSGQYLKSQGKRGKK